MKAFVSAILMSLLTLRAFASSVEWGSFIMLSLRPGNSTLGYAGEGLYTDTNISMSTVRKGGSLSIMEDGGTSLVSFASWIVAMEGDTVDGAMFADRSKIFFANDGKDCNPFTTHYADDSFYLAFQTLVSESESLGQPWETRYGWVEVGVLNGELYVKDSAIMLDAGAIYVGGSEVIPEPSAGVLLLLGLGLLGLRRCRGIARL